MTRRIAKKVVRRSSEGWAYRPSTLLAAFRVISRDWERMVTSGQVVPVGFDRLIRQLLVVMCEAFEALRQLFLRMIQQFFRVDVTQP